MSKQDTLSAMLKQYETNANSSTKNNNVKEYDLKNYFTTFLPDKVKSATKRIRVLPTKDGSSPFVEIFGHKAQIDGDWKTFICLKHEKNEDCPFCEANDELRATGKETDKELAKKYNARRMYVAKVIDRDNESDGVKFWRFNHDYRKEGALDKIYGVIQAIAQTAAKDFTDEKTGRDLLVMIVRDAQNRPKVNSIAQIDPSPLSDNAELAKEWLSDDRTWEDVYSIKPYEYLEIIVKGGTPMWDKEAKKFIDKAAVSDTQTIDDEITLGVPNVKSNVVTANSQVPVSTTGENTEDDLPF